MRHALVVSEIALSIVTLAGAGLMLRSLATMYGVDLGFRPENVLAIAVAPPVATHRRARSRCIASSPSRRRRCRKW